MHLAGMTRMWEIGSGIEGYLPLVDIVEQCRQPSVKICSNFNYIIVYRFILSGMPQYSNSETFRFALLLGTTI